MSEVHKNDRWSVEARKNDKYWLCECGVARESVDKIFKHCQENHHFAELIVEETGEVKAFLAAGLTDHNKYGMQVPDSALIKREKNKNNPMFPRFNE